MDQIDEEEKAIGKGACHEQHDKVRSGGVLGRAVQVEKYLNPGLHNYGDPAFAFNERN